MRGYASTVTALFVIGFLSFSLQVYLVRESVSLFHGNEMVAGIVLALWMLLTGAGARTGRFPRSEKADSRILPPLMVLLCLLPLPTLLAEDLFRALFFPPGVRIPPEGIIGIPVLAMLPFCLLSGYLFTRYSLHYSGMHPDIANTGPGRAYAAEAAGSLAGGAIVSFLFLWFLDTGWGLKLSSLTGILLLIATSPRSSVTWAGLLILVVLHFMVPDPGRLTATVLFPRQQVIHQQETPYGKVTVTMQPGQLSYYVNGSLLFSSGNIIFNEELVHPALVQHPSPRTVLMISGGLSGAEQEIARYGDVQVDYLELNPSLIATGYRYSARFGNHNFRPLAADGRSFVRRTPRRYDVVLVSAGEPSSLSANRYFTAEWFDDVKRVLNRGGIISVSLATAGNYQGEEASALNASLYRTLQSKFSHVMIVPLARNHFIASDVAPDIDIGRLVAEKQIPTLYVNQYYLDPESLKKRSEMIIAGMPPRTEINRDFHPVSFRWQTDYWLSYFHGSLYTLIILSVLLFVAAFLFSPAGTAGVLAAGATGASLQILLIFALQVISGMIYRYVGIMMLAFMAGLAAGPLISGIFPVRYRQKTLLMSLILFSLTCFMLPPYISWINNLLPSPATSVFLLGIPSLLAGLWTGLVYGFVVASLPLSRGAGIAAVYSADLFGAAAATILVTLCLFPCLGITATCVILAILNLAAAARITGRTG